MKTELHLISKGQFLLDSVLSLLPHLKKLAFSTLAVFVLATSSLLVNAQTWSSTGSLSVGRLYHTATLLPSGKILITGGCTSIFNGVSNCEIYDPSTGKYSGTESMSIDRSHHTASLLPSGKVMVTGGFSYSTWTSLKTSEIYDPTTGTWSSTDTMSIERYYHTATNLSSGKILVTGGFNVEYIWFNTCEIYDPLNGTWSVTGSMRYDRYYHTATLLTSGNVLVIGGMSMFEGNQSSCEIYDTSSGSWNLTGSMEFNRQFHSATLLNSGKVLVAGGQNYPNQNNVKIAEIYDPFSGTWTQTGSMENARMYHTATLLSCGKVLVVGGLDEIERNASKCEIYDPLSGLWTQTGSMSTYRINNTATSLPSGKVLVTGGFAAAGQGIVESEIYTPATTNASTPTISASSMSICESSNTTLSISSGSINDATNWIWYKDSCGGTRIDTGITIQVSPNTTTTYFARGEGGCSSLGACASITITVKSVPVLNPVSDITIETPPGTCTYPVNFNASASGNPTPQLKYYIEGYYNYGPFEYEVFSGDRFDPHYAYAYPTPATINVIASNACGSDTDQFIVTLFGKKVGMQCYGDEIFTLDSGETTYIDYSNGHGSTPGTHTILDADILSHCGFGGGPYYRFTGATISHGFTDLHSTPFNVGTTRVTAFAYDEGTGFFLDEYLFVEKKIDSLLWLMADSCFFYVTILERPVDIIQCVNNQDVNPNYLGSRYLVSNNDLDPIKHLNRSLIKSITNNFNHDTTLNGASFGTGTTRVLWTAIDTADRIDTCSFTITVNNCGAGIPKNAKPFDSNKAISTQTEMNNFYDIWSGEKWTKIEGNLTINGGNNDDPITDFCNLRAITEVTGHLLIQQFTKPGNPTSLQDLGGINKVGRLTIITCPKFETISLPELTQVAGSVIIRNNVNAKTIALPKLQSMGGEWLHFQRNHRLENLSVSNNASSFKFTHSKAGIDIQKNGDSTSNPLTMDLNKINVVKGDFIFSMNKNSGVSNFDNIFSGLDSVKGKLQITDNTYLSKCCIAASTVVINGRTISSNTGNCANLTAVSSDCGTLYKRSKLPENSGGEAINTVSFNVYPNPNSGFFSLDVITSQSGTVKITITDLMGRTVWTHSENVSISDNIPMNLSFAAEGQYILKAEMNGHVFVKRVMLVK